MLLVTIRCLIISNLFPIIFALLLVNQFHLIFFQNTFTFIFISVKTHSTKLITNNHIFLFSLFFYIYIPIRGKPIKPTQKHKINQIIADVQTRNWKKKWILLNCQSESQLIEHCNCIDWMSSCRYQGQIVQLQQQLANER